LYTVVSYHKEYAVFDRKIKLKFHCVHLQYSYVSRETNSSLFWLWWQKSHLHVPHITFSKYYLQYLPNNNFFLNCSLYNPPSIKKCNSCFLINQLCIEPEIKAAVEVSNIILYWTFLYTIRYSLTKLHLTVGKKFLHLLLFFHFYLSVRCIFRIEFKAY
jgi:hypothetical protein